MDETRHHAHTPEAIRARLARGPKVNYLRDWVYGGIDGVVTTFAIVAGVVGASLSPAIVLILGFANLIGDGFSMAASNYSGTKTEIDNYDRLRKIERRHIDRYRDGEVEEIRQIYKAKGLSGEDLENVVTAVTGNENLWLDVMLFEEYGVTPFQRTAIKAALSTFAAFIICGAMPLLPFMFGFGSAFIYALAFSALTFFAIGSFKSIWSVQSWWRSGLETTLIGLSAAGLAFLIGWLLRGLGANTV